MNSQITFKNIDATESLKEHVNKKVSKFEKYIPYNFGVNVILGVEKKAHWAEITCHVEHKELVSHAKTDNMYESIDLAVHKMETQFKKEREKKKGHAQGHLMARQAEHLASDLEAELPHQEKLSKTKS